MSKYSNIGVLGDLHGNKGWTRVALACFAEAGVTEILQLGDMGFWPGNAGQKFLYKTNKYLGENNQRMYVTLGNHEDYVQISRFQPHPDMPGFVYNPVYPNILVAKRGVRWEWEGVSFVSLGGANSIDFRGRTEGVDWWKAERITLQDVFNTVEGGHADIMVCHDCPAGVPLFGDRASGSDGWTPMELFYAQQSREALRKAVDGVKPDLLLHGHYHFYADHTTVLNDGINDYTLHSVGLNMDASRENMAVLTLPDKTLELLPLSYSALTEFYRNRELS